jgi:hypothetical protein
VALYAYGRDDAPSSLLPTEQRRSRRDPVTFEQTEGSDRGSCAHRVGVDGLRTTVPPAQELAYCIPSTGACQQLQYACQFKLNLIFNTFEPIYLLAALILISSVDLLAESATPITDA